MADCPICLFPPKTEAGARILPCKHKYCSNCLESWILQRPLAPSCPICKSKISRRWISKSCPRLRKQVLVFWEQERKTILSENFILMTTKACPGCGWRIIKDGGCDSVRCPRVSCGRHFCYKCQVNSCKCSPDWREVAFGLLFSFSVPFFLLLLVLFFHPT